MSLSSGVLRDPITITEIRDCLGENTLNLKALSLSNKINPWSRKKFVEINTPTPQRNIDWWKGSAGDCGIMPPNRVSTFAAVRNLYNGGMNGWVYVHPTTWARILDMNGYDHTAEPPVGDMDVQATYLEGNDIQVSIYKGGTEVDDTGSGSLTMADISVDGKSLGEWYVGIALVDDSGNVKGFIANQKGFDAQSYSYPTDSSMVNKSYTVVPFLSSVKLDKDSGNATEGKLLSIPVVQPKRVKVISSSANIGIGVEGLWNTARTQITINVYITNYSSSTMLFTGSNTARVRFVGKSFEAAMEAGETDISLGNITVAPDDTVTITRYYSVPASYRDRDFQVYVRLVSGGVNYDGGPEEVLTDDSNIQ